MPLKNVLAIAFISILLVSTLWFADIIIDPSVPFEAVDGLIAEHDLQFHFYGWHQGYSILLVDNLNRLIRDKQISNSLRGGSSEQISNLLGQSAITYRKENSVTMRLSSPEGTREVTVDGYYTFETWDPLNAKLTINNTIIPVNGDMIVAIDLDQNGPTIHKIDADLSEIAVQESESASQPEAPAVSEIKDYILKSRPILDVLIHNKQEKK